MSLTWKTQIFIMFLSLSIHSSRRGLVSSVSAYYLQKPGFISQSVIKNKI